MVPDRIRRIQHMGRSENTGRQDKGRCGTDTPALAEATGRFPGKILSCKRRYFRSKACPEAPSAPNVWRRRDTNATTRGSIFLHLSHSALGSRLDGESTIYRQ